MSNVFDVAKQSNILLDKQNFRCLTNNVWLFGHVTKHCLIGQNLIGNALTFSVRCKQKVIDEQYFVWCGQTIKHFVGQTNFRFLTNNVWSFGLGLKSQLHMRFLAWNGDRTCWKMFAATGKRKVPPEARNRFLKKMSCNLKQHGCKLETWLLFLFRYKVIIHYLLIFREAGVQKVTAIISQQMCTINKKFLRQRLLNVV